MARGGASFPIQNMTQTPFRLRLISAVLAAAVFASSCGGGGAGPTPEPGPVAQDGPDEPTTALSAATPSEDVERLRALGFQVAETTGESAPENVDEPVVPIVVPAAPDPAASTAAASAPRMQILSASSERAQPLIVGGSFASPNQFNFAAFVRTDAGTCTGSLIAPQWVKTAAHCMPGTTTGSVTAYLGSVTRGVGTEVINADYFVRLDNDTALVHLSVPSKFTTVAYNGDPIFDLAPGPLLSMGWGTTSYGGSPADLKFVENNTVVRGAPFSLVVGTPSSYQTVCNGDSGGPSIRFDAAGYPIDIATTSATYSPFCTGLFLAMTTSALASTIESIIGVPPGAVPTTNQPPVVPPVAPLETALGPTSISIPASDPEGDPLLFSATGLPAGLSINEATGVISGTTTQYTGLSPSTVTVSVTDKKTSARRSVTFPWRVNTPGNASPVVSPVAATQSRAGQSTQLTLTASDPNGDPLTWTASGLPTGLAMSTSGVISGTPTRGGAFQVNAYASDMKGGSGMTSFTWVVTNEKPVVRVLIDSPSQIVTVATGGQVSVGYEATDPDPGDAVKVTATGLPSGVVLDTATKTIRGSSRLSGLFTVVLDAADLYGGISSTAFTLAITSSANRPPTINQLQSRSDLPGVPITPIPLNPVDPDGHSMVLSFNALPPGIRFDATTKALVGTPTKGGVFPLAYSVSDTLGAVTRYEPITWTIPNTAPVVSPPPAAETLPGVPFTTTYTASDPEGHPFTMIATGLPKGLVVNNNTKTIAGTPMASGTFSVTLTATDKFGGKTVAQPFQITIPNGAPTVGAPLPNMTTVAGTPVSVPLNVSDPENHRLLITVSGINVYPLASSLPPGLLINSTTKTISGTPSRGGVYTVSLKVADIYGAFTYMPAFTWTVINTKPTLQPVSNVSMRIGAAATLQLSATDPEGHAITYKVSGLPTGLRVGAATGLVSGTPTAVAGTYRVTAYARDLYGLNSDTVTFTITLTN